MQMLYDSDDFVVVYVNAAEVDDINRHNAGKPKRDGFEIVDKRSNKGVYLDGSWAAAFQRQIEKWQAHTPDQDEVENTLATYTGLLAQNPLLMH